jgi:CubicO group peptidase (beta-lactamase class C family)
MPQQGDPVRVTRHDDPAALGLDPVGLDALVSTLRQWHEAGDAGMQLAVYRHGILAMAVACGKDPFSGQPIGHDTLFCLLSTTKALAAIAMLHLQSQAQFRWSDAIADYWPRFAQGGKETATIEHLMCHRIGIPNVTAPWQRWADRSYMTRLIETSNAEWVPGTRYGYHGGCFGLIIDELCRRIAGRSTGAIVNEIAAQIGHPDCYIGIAAGQMSRVARLQFLEKDQCVNSGYDHIGHPPFGFNGYYNNEQVLMSCQPSGGGVASAHDLAGVLNLLASWGRYRMYQGWTAAAQVHASRSRSPSGNEQPASPGLDGGHWGLGFLVAPTPRVFGTVAPGPWTVGHAGASGSVAYADPDLGLSVAFTINGVRGRRQFLRYTVLGDLVQRALK